VSNSSKYQAVFREKQKANGLVQLMAWVPATELETIKALIRTHIEGKPQVEPITSEEVAAPVVSTSRDLEVGGILLQYVGDWNEGGEGDDGWHGSKYVGKLNGFEVVFEPCDNTDEWDVHKVDWSLPTDTGLNFATGDNSAKSLEEAVINAKKLTQERAAAARLGLQFIEQKLIGFVGDESYASEYIGEWNGFEVRFLVYAEDSVAWFLDTHKTNTTSLEEAVNNAKKAIDYRLHNAIVDNERIFLTQHENGKFSGTFFPEACRGNRWTERFDSRADAMKWLAKKGYDADGNSLPEFTNLAEQLHSYLSFRCDKVGVVYDLTLNVIDTELRKTVKRVFWCVKMDRKTNTIIGDTWRPELLAEWKAAA